MAIVLLLGAGASFGSLGVKPYPPPLGNKLFPELVKRNGVAATLPHHIKRAFEIDFEDGMAKYYAFSRGNIMTFQRELAEYLASFYPTDSNVYIELIKNIGCKRVIYSSLNYDLLLELSASKVGYLTNYSSTHKHGSIRILKIHGSSNFWPDLPTRALQSVRFYDIEKADIQIPIRPLSQYDTLYKCRVEDSVAPAIAMFAIGKKVKISPDFVDQQYDMWVEQVCKASKIIVVGVRVHEVDEHIWSLLGKIKGNVMYFGFDNDKPEFETWKKNNNKKNAYFYKSDFKTSVKTISRMCKY